MSGHGTIVFILCASVHVAAMAASAAIMHGDPMRTWFFRQKTAVQKLVVPVIMAPLAVMALVPQPGIPRHGTALVVAGLACIALAAVFWAAALFRIGFIPSVRKAEGLVTGGIYSVVRNPIYTGNVLILPGLAMACNFPHALLFSPAVFLLFLVLVFVEERGLRRTYGAEYAAYAGRVRHRIVPYII
ncbi:MAG: isoprenylcysteine carboxylmethyltransferase family protein [Spirochaetes bacterium]|nr:isoprenylcysteine carboxylmethyltransferase family protein [Spirochaetota bacterium]